MGLFSERYGYIKPSEVIIREKITLEIQNAICSCYDRLQDNLFDVRSSYDDNPYIDLEKYLWTFFLNNREGEFRDGRSYRIVATTYIEGKSIEWFKKLDLVEFTIKYLYAYSQKNNRFYSVLDTFVRQLNQGFERLNFAYRILNNEIVEVSSKEEIITIENALQSKQKNIRVHLNKALELYAKRPIGDYRNSIKESISAVEAFCREKTGEDTLGKALNKLENNGVIIPKLLKLAFEKLYAYTNQSDTGIRHALMDSEDTYTPTSDEALFMLVSCSSFINYLNKKAK
jgi:hypothetical protein